MSPLLPNAADCGKIIGSPGFPEISLWQEAIPFGIAALHARVNRFFSARPSKNTNLIILVFISSTTLMPDLYISWSEYHQTIEKLAAKIYQSQWQFNQIICIARGGLRVGDILSRIYEKPLAILSASSYGGAGGQVRGEIHVSQHLTMSEEKLGDRILLVDDLADSGVSLQETFRWLNAHYGAEIAEIRTAVLWCKASSCITPDYYVDYLPENPWIHQPFERYEQISPAEIAAACEEVAIAD